MWKDLRQSQCGTKCLQREDVRVSVNKKAEVTQDKHGYYSPSLLGRVRRKNSIATRKKLALSQHGNPKLTEQHVDVVQTSGHCL